MVKKLKKSKVAPKPRYYIRCILCSVITSASVLAMVAGTTAVIVFILYYRLIIWIDQVVTSSILLNIQISTEGAALNTQD
jgi:hypothetical protein